MRNINSTRRMRKELLIPDYIFESSWEVCNKVGGIYTVLSTHTKTLQEKIGKNLFFIGPDFKDRQKNILFQEDKRLFYGWKKKAFSEGLSVRIGYWDIPGRPFAILVDFQPFYEQKNDIYTQMWIDFGVDSLHAYGDYDEASMFSYAAGKVVESFFYYYKLQNKQVIYHAHEWMCGMGVLYLRKKCPEIATVFTTHATTIGRSIAGNHKPLYDYLTAYNGNQMAEELNVQSKHSIERQSAHYVDCFTTVSEVTASECKVLLEKDVDKVLPNGFENEFIPTGKTFARTQKESRGLLLNLVKALTGKSPKEDSLLIGISGRYEFKNKGIDLYLDSIQKLRQTYKGDKEVIAFVTIPAWAKEIRADIVARLKETNATSFEAPLPEPYITHHLHHEEGDAILSTLKHYGIQNQVSDTVKVIFIPAYLDKGDQLFNRDYYALLMGLDLTIYPSYYEPWGYTPLESIAFHIPTVTTSLAGFGQWVMSALGRDASITDGVAVIQRTDRNYDEVAEQIKDTILYYLSMNKEERDKIQKKAHKLSQKALWKHFIQYYIEAYHIALTNKIQRTTKI